MRAVLARPARRPESGNSPGPTSLPKRTRPPRRNPMSLHLFSTIDVAPIRRTARQIIGRPVAHIAFEARAVPASPPRRRTQPLSPPSPPPSFPKRAEHSRRNSNHQRDLSSDKLDRDWRTARRSPRVRPAAPSASLVSKAATIREALGAPIGRNRSRTRRVGTARAPRPDEGRGRPSVGRDGARSEAIPIDATLAPGTEIGRTEGRTSGAPSRARTGRTVVATGIPLPPRGPVRYTVRFARQARGRCAETRRDPTTIQSSVPAPALDRRHDPAPTSTEPEIRGR
ncbi:hypothetical protein ElP_03420 [Tautonia plasticadhaerens]|uniref:Uncharacterized protein n=1 Tax=Tautonia plasticadhaerens TaxID=2527974 RepID=A0A518GV90_9BACT|nr:hypothetical protein ElP_03420 [Tautonia plasticadhaerens]